MIWTRICPGKPLFRKWEDKTFSETFWGGPMSHLEL